MVTHSQIKIREQHSKKFIKNNDCKNIYHYTSIEALYGMIANGELWWGNTAEMNDTAELKNFADKIKKKLKKEISSSDKIEAFFKIVNEKIEDEYPYAMSFTKLASDVSQWERYADNANGVRIGYNTDKIFELFFSQKVLFSPVYYYENFKGDGVKNHELYPLLKEYFETGDLGVFESEDQLVDNLILCSTIFKNKCFESEKEIRLLNLPGIDICSDNENFMETHEIIGKQIKRILKINLRRLCEEQKINIEDIYSNVLIGPRSKQSVVALKNFCKEFGYYKLAGNIKKSKCSLM